MTRNRNRYFFYSVFAILFMLLITNIIAIIEGFVSGKQKSIIFLFLWLLLLVVVIVLQFMIYRMGKKDLKRDNYITNIIHDCKTPITTINIVCQTIDNIGIKSEDELKYYSDIVKIESSKLIVMIENILNLIRLDNVCLDYNQELDVHQTIKDAVDSMRFLIRNLDGEIITFLHSENHHIKGNSDVMLSIISNVINNAIKYTESSPRIIISTKTIADNIEISIKDNGIGMEENELDNIFDKTYRIPSSSTHCNGSGLGLYYVKENVMRMNGKIMVVSSSGSGSEFRITLPIVK